MGLIKDYSWICIHTLTDEKKAHALEQVFYENNLPIQVRDGDTEVSIWVPMKFKDLSVDVMENFFKGNLADGFVNFKEKEKPEDKIYIGREYERRIPPKFYFFLLIIAFFIFLLRLTYGFDFL